MRAGAAGKETHPIVELAQRAERIGDARFEPADHSGAEAAENNTLVISAAHGLIEAVQAPDRQQIGGVSAADVDDVLIEKQLAGVAIVAPK
jgi:hypothetical protein